MSYQLLSQTFPKARKVYACIWCGEPILKGEVHEKYVGTYYRELQSCRFHKECGEAQTEYFHENRDEEFFPGEFKRGTTEER
jgi:hypothetical protein